KVEIAGLGLVELANGYTRATERDLSRPAANLDQAERTSRRILEIYPYDSSAWARLAYLDARRNGALRPAGVKALATGYDLVAYDPYVAFWRIGFCLEHWNRLSPQLRRAVSAEVRTF